MRSRPLSLFLGLTFTLLVSEFNAAPRFPANNTNEGGGRRKAVLLEGESPPVPTGGERLAHASSFDATTLESLVFEYINAERHRHRMPPFNPDRSLWQAARAHSGDMAARNYFSHDAPRGLMRKTGFGDRLRSHGVVARQMAENIAMLPLVNSRTMMKRSDQFGRQTTDVREARLSYERLAAWAVQQWMESPGHRKNILNPSLRMMGVGVAVGKRGQEEYVYLTQEFGG